MLDFFFNLLFCFFKDKNIFLINFNFSVSSIFEGFYLFGWKFFFNKTDFFLGCISYNNLRYHKLRLIKILSLNCFFSFFYILKLLNKEILLWTFNFSFSDLFYGVSFKLDFFTYKLIWKLVRKLHPRRPNTWIYNKYWKFYNNTIKFVLYDFSSSQLLFLITHSVIFFPYRNFPNFLNNYDYSNIKRVNFLSYNSFFGYLYNVYYYLWKRQFGLCVMCFRVFDVSKEFNFKIVSLKNNCFNYRTFSLVLIHKYC